MDIEVHEETIECPSCQGNKTMRWGGEDYPCLLCKGDGEIELKKELTIRKSE